MSSIYAWPPPSPPSFPSFCAASGLASAKLADESVLEDPIRESIPWVISLVGSLSRAPEEEDEVQ